MVTPKGRIINSCTVNHWTLFMLIMGTQVSKLTAVQDAKHAKIDAVIVRLDVQGIKDLPGTCVDLDL